MPVAESFFNAIAAIKEQSPETTKKIEAVLLHSRARQMHSQTRIHLMVAVAINLPLHIVIQIVAFALFPVTNTLKFIVCATLATGIYLSAEIFELSPLHSSLIGYCVAYAVSNLIGTINFFRAVFFDLADIVSFGSITKLLSKVYISSGRKGCEILVTPNNKWYALQSWPSIFFIHRQPYQSPLDLAAVQDKLNKLTQDAADPEVVEGECDAYWGDFSGN